MKRTSHLTSAVLLALAAGAGACPAVTMGINGDLTAFARLGRAKAIRAAAYLVAPGNLRVNIEPEPQTAEACGLTVYIKEARPGHATLEVRCPEEGKPHSTKDAGGAMGSLFEKTGFSVVSFNAVFTPESIDFTVGDETENAGCFELEPQDMRDKKIYQGCFIAKGLFPIEEPKRLKPIVK